MKNFEMIVKDVFYLADDRMVFSGQFITNDSMRLPIDATVYVNERSAGQIQLTTLPFASGKNIKRDIDIIESSKQIDLKFVNWKQDTVILRACHK